MALDSDLLVSAVLFDMDGTLVDSTRVVEAMWGEFAARHKLDPDVLIPRSHGRQTIDTIREFLPALEATEQDALEHRFTSEEVRRTDGVQEVPGAAALIEALDAIGARVAVVTSASRELAVARMTAAGVPVPAIMVTPAEIERGKPDPQGYLHAAARLDVPIAACVVLEDADAGIAAAVASGARVIVVGPHHSVLTAGLTRVQDLRGIMVVESGDGLRLHMA